MPSEQQVQTLRIMSYNIHSGRDLKNVPSLPQIAKVIVEHKPDFVGLQELGTYLPNLPQKASQFISCWTRH